MAIPQPGYIGVLSVGGQKIRCTSFSLNPEQKPLFYNHIIGLNDTVTSDGATKNDDPGNIQTQRRIWRPSTVLVGGSLAFPATQNTISTFFDPAKDGSFIDSIDFKYYCGEGKSFSQCRVGGYGFSVQSGDIANITVDLVGIEIEVDPSVGTDQYIEPEKLMTWDTISVAVSGASFTVDSALITAIDFKINNNANPVYVSGAPGADLTAYDIRLGTQEVEGTVTVYLKSGYEYIPTSLSSVSTITITAASGWSTWSTNIDVVFHSNRMDGLVGPVVTSLPFSGVDKAFGT